MAERASPKKDKIIALFNKYPTLSNSDLADITKSSPHYVRKLINPLRSTYQPPSQKKQKARQILNKLYREEWTRFKSSQIFFAQNYLPQKTYVTERPFLQQQREDFLGETRGDFDYFLPTDDAMGSSGTGEDLGGSWSQYEYLSEKRIGLGPKICRMPAEDAVLEGFKFLDKKTREVVPTTKILNKHDQNLNVETWMENADFLNMLAKVIYLERVYGCGFLISYFSEDDKARGVLGEAIKESEGYIKAFDAIAPTQASPSNSYESDKLDKDPQKWNLFGGPYDSQDINYTRVRVFMSRPSLTRWYGVSIYEPIWHSVIPYYMGLIFLLRGFAKVGNTVMKYIIDSEEDLDDIVNLYGDLIDDMKMNGTIIGKLGAEIGFEPTQLAKGLKELFETWIEDISAGTQIPVPILMGRIVSSGLSGVGYLVAERYYMKMVKRIQLAFTDDVRALITLAGFDISNYVLDWNLSITKTDQQRLMDETMEVELEILKEELLQKRVMTDTMIAQSMQPQSQQQQNQPNPNPTAKTPSNGGKKALDATQMQVAKDMQESQESIRERVKQRRMELMKEWNKPMNYNEVLEN